MIKPRNLFLVHLFTSLVFCQSSFLAQPSITMPTLSDLANVVVQANLTDKHRETGAVTLRKERRMKISEDRTYVFTQYVVVPILDEQAPPTTVA